MHKIVVPYLTFENEKIDTPVGLSELLEPTWSLDVDNEGMNEVVNQFKRTTYKRPNGRWSTKFEKVHAQ